MEFHVSINGIPVCARYSEESVDRIFLPFLRELTRLQKSLGRRIVVLLAAPPGAGKSTLCAFLKFLADREESLTPLTVIGMDGFHRYQDDLLAHTTVRDGKELRLVEIKGAPITFDLPRLTEALRRVAAGENCGWPTYDRMTHNPQENAVTVTGEIVLLEGNYLLLDEPGWRELRQFADYTVRIIADPDELRPRLVARKIASGTDEQTAINFVERSDLDNARLCLERTRSADLTLYLRSDGTYATK